ncbi:hypothetical protein [Leifsonia sp. P73]|uniref:hypothetical protein n=1 Tax=Leifsonia sp. P73 TaxID=3423959 RepID=UPI003DA55C81
MEPRLAYPASGIDAVRGTVAVERGPLVLCAESTDLPQGVHVDEIRLHDGHPIAATPTGARARITLTRSAPAEWPYATRSWDQTDVEELDLELKPYFAWANNGPSTMRVFLPRHGS